MVLKYLNDDEAFKVAINLEREGLRFYTEVVRNLKDEKTRKVFLRLAEDEKNHLVILTERLREL